VEKNAGEPATYSITNKGKEKLIWQDFKILI
jgi:hypothetical protein